MSFLCSDLIALDDSLFAPSSTISHTNRHKYVKKLHDKIQITIPGWFLTKDWTQLQMKDEQLEIVKNRVEWYMMKQQFDLARKEVGPLVIYLEKTTSLGVACVSEFAYVVGSVYLGCREYEEGFAFMHGVFQKYAALGSLLYMLRLACLLLHCLLKADRKNVHYDPLFLLSHYLFYWKSILNRSESLAWLRFFSVQLSEIGLIEEAKKILKNLDYCYENKCIKSDVEKFAYTGFRENCCDSRSVSEEIIDLNSWIDALPIEKFIYISTIELDDADGARNL